MKTLTEIERELYISGKPREHLIMAIDNEDAQEFIEGIQTHIRDGLSFLPDSGWVRDIVASSGIKLTPKLQELFDTLELSYDTNLASALECFNLAQKDLK